MDMRQQFLQTGKEVITVKVKVGDVLVCQCKDCQIELTVTKTCSDDKCTHEAEECELDASCCGEPMKLKK